MLLLYVMHALVLGAHAQVERHFPCGDPEQNLTRDGSQRSGSLKRLRGSSSSSYSSAPVPSGKQRDSSVLTRRPWTRGRHSIAGMRRRAKSNIASRPGLLGSGWPCASYGGATELYMFLTSPPWTGKLCRDAWTRSRLRLVQLLLLLRQRRRRRSTTARKLQPPPKTWQVCRLQCCKQAPKNVWPRQHLELRW